MRHIWRRPTARPPRSPEMSETLRNQLLGLGFKPAPKPERPKPSPQAGQPKPAHGAKPGQGGKPAHGKPAQGQGRPQHGKPAQANARPAHGKPRTREDIDLAKAYAIRAQR